jgi:hypothetical protein
MFLLSSPLLSSALLCRFVQVKAGASSMMADFRWLFDPKALNTQLTGNPSILYCTVLYSTVLCCVVLHYTVSHYTPSILYCTPLLYRALSRSPALCPQLDLPACCLSPVISLHPTLRLRHTGDLDLKFHILQLVA